MGQKEMKVSVINIGCGKNPLTCAKNIDPDKQSNANEYTDAEKLSDLNSSVDVVIMISPYDYSPLQTDAARVLKPGGLLIVIGNERNDFFSQVYNADDIILNEYGYECKSRGRAHRHLNKSRTTSGYPINPKNLKQIVLRRKKDAKTY